MKLRSFLAAFFLLLAAYVPAPAEGINSGAVIGGVEGISNPSGGAPSWVLPGFTAANAIDCRWGTGQFWPSAAACALTVARATSGYANFANGNWQSFAPGVARITDLGLKVEEARTNSLRNSTMAGAVVGTARTVVTITSLSRTASATALAAATGTNVAVNDQVTITGASVASYNGTFTVSAVNAGVSFSYLTTTSTTDSATGASYTAISPGTYPTNWSQSQNTGLIPAVVGVGTSSGLNYTAFRLAGVVSGGTNNNMQFETQNGIAASSGQTWAASYFYQLCGGSLTNIASLQEVLFGTNGTTGTESFQLPVTNPTISALGLQRAIAIQPLGNAGTTNVASEFQVVPTINTQIDVTLCIGQPQLELGASMTTPIPTINAAVTRNADLVNFTTPPVFGSSYSFQVGYTPDAAVTYGSNQGAMSLNDGTSANRVVLLRSSGSGIGAASLVVSGAGQSTPPDGTVLAAGALSKQAYALSAGTQTASWNGNMSTATNATVASVSTITLGSRFSADSAAMANGFICRSSVNPTGNIGTMVTANTTGGTC